MSPAERRAVATTEIQQLCASILERVAQGPNHKEPTNAQDAARFEQIVSDLQTARDTAARL